MPDAQPTVDELVALLKATALPTVIVEGDTDMSVVRWIESTLGATTANMLPCGGRTALFALFERRQELPGPIAFMADLDMYVVSGVPLAMKQIVWTEGYSLENDAYVGAEQFLRRLMTPEETQVYERLLDSICLWFAEQIRLHLAGQPAACGTSVCQLIPIGGTQLEGAFEPQGLPADRIAFVREFHGTLV